MANKEFEGEAFEFPDEKEAREKKETTQVEDKFEIEIEDDTPPADRGRKPAPPPEDATEEELASYDEKVQARIKKFTRGYHDERRAKEEALRERQAAEEYARRVLEENKRLKEHLATGSKQFIETSKSAAEIELAAAERKFKQAYEDNDAEALALAQKEITRATIKLEKAQEMKPVEVEEKDDFKPAEPDKPRYTPRAQRWIDSNADWWGKDEEMTLAAMGIDKKLQREYGAEYVGSEEYFKTIDKTMRKRFPEYFDTQSEDDPPPKKRAEPADEDDEPPRRAQKPAAVVAPASRSTPPSRVRLKASEAAIARKLGVPLEEYAKQVAIIGRGN